MQKISICIKMMQKTTQTFQQPQKSDCWRHWS